MGMSFIVSYFHLVIESILILGTHINESRFNGVRLEDDIGVFYYKQELKEFTTEYGCIIHKI